MREGQRAAGGAAADARRAALPISIERVAKRYGSVAALDGVDLEIRSGEFMTLLGPSGSGKTTLLMVLAGFTRPDSGIVRFGDREVTRLAPHRRDVGMVFQSYALFPHMSVAGNVAFPLKLRGIGGAEAAARVEKALATVRLAGYGERRIQQLSGGQRQRVALARAIVFEPSILLMDEPLSALDKQLREEMQIELRSLHEALGMTTVYVTHDQREALTMSDRIAVIDHGRLMQLDAPRALYDRPANRFVAEFIGEAVFLPLAAAGAEVSLPPGTTVPRQPVLMLRPERLRILRADDPAPGLNRFRARVETLVYQGESFLLQARLADGTLVPVRAPSTREAMQAAPSPGAEVTLAIAPEDVVLLDGGAA